MAALTRPNAFVRSAYARTPPPVHIPNISPNSDADLHTLPLGPSASLPVVAHVATSLCHAERCVGSETPPARLPRQSPQPARRWPCARGAQRATDPAWPPPKPSHRQRHVIAQRPPLLALDATDSDAVRPCTSFRRTRVAQAPPAPSFSQAELLPQTHPSQAPRPPGFSVQPAPTARAHRFTDDDRRRRRYTLRWQ